MKLVKISLPILLIIISCQFYEFDNIKKARNVINKIKSVCQSKSNVLTHTDFKNILSDESITSNEWLIFQQKSSISLQYPYSFWSQVAPGRVRISEFIPIPYSYIVKIDDCRKFTKN